ncbi:MAG: glucosyltransferase domain-containing protein [Lachnospiraceae bacterium]|nr:glucosyltransferase domain-containing protein [Lachnospiraceae bacterium]
MEKPGTIHKAKQPLLFLAADLLITLLAWGRFCHRQFGADTVFQMILPPNNIVAWLQHGRYATYLINQWLYEAGVLTTEHYFLFFVLFLLLIIGSIWLTQMLLLPYLSDRLSGSIPGQIAFVTATAFIFTNVLFSEHFMFPECHGSFGAAYFFGILGVMAIIGKKSVRGFACIILSCLFYQTADILTAMLLTAALVFAHDFRLSRELVLKEILYNVLILSVGFLNTQSTKLLIMIGVMQEGDITKHISLDLVGNFFDLSERILKLMKNSMGLMPSVWAPLLVLIASLLLLFIPLIRGKKKEETCTVLLCLLAEILLFFVLPLFSGVFPPRIAFTWYALQAVILLMALYHTEKKTLRMMALCALCGLYLIWQMIACQKIITNRYISNDLDLYYAGLVLEEIEKHEAETGVAVTKIAFENDAYAPNNYEQVHYKYEQINERVLTASPFVLLEYVNGPGIALKHVPMDPQIYEEHFAGKNWDDFDPSEQMVFVDDTVYWIIF